MIDKIVEYEEGQSLSAIKNITGGEWIYENGYDLLGGRFPETLIIEAAAQTALAYFHANDGFTEGKKIFLGKVDAEFFHEVKVGDRLTFKTGSFKKMGKSGFISVVCSRGDEAIASVQVFYGLSK